MSDKLFNLPQFLPPVVDKYLSYPTIFSLIVIFQGCFGGMGVIQTPSRLTKAINHPIFRFIFLSAIAYTASSDVETALFSVTIFLVFLHLLRTKEEKKKLNGVYF